MFYAYRFVRPYLALHKKRYALSFITAIIENLLSAYPTYLVGIVVDLLMNGRLTMSLMWWFFLSVFLSVVFSYVSSAVYNIAIYGNYNLSERYYQENFINLILKKRQVFFEKYSVGDLMSRATMDTMYISDLLGWGMSLIFFTGTKIVLYLVLLILRGGLLFSLLCIIPYSFMLIYVHKNEVRMEKIWQERQKAFAKLNDKVLEGVEGVRNLRAYAQEQSFRQRFEERTKAYSTMSNKLNKMSRVVSLVTESASVIVFLFAMGIGSYRVSQGLMTVGDLISFQIFLTGLGQAIVPFAMNFNIIQNANISAKRIQEMYDTDDLMRDTREEIQEFVSLEVKDYSFGYPGAENKLLKDINLQMTKGETIAVVGKTGGGKTTFLRQLLCEYPAGQGSFRINDIPLEDMKAGGLAKALSFVTQEHQFFSGSIRDNVAFSVEEATDDEIKEALDLANFSLEGEIERQGLDTIIGEKGISISGGQRQRLSIARALLKNPSLLVLDDSLSAVDQSTERKILANLRRIRKGKSTIISSHRMSAVQEADCIYVFQEGRITEAGTHEELLALGGWYAEQFYHQERSHA